MYQWGTYIVLCAYFCRVTCFTWPIAIASEAWTSYYYQHVQCMCTIFVYTYLIMCWFVLVLASNHEAIAGLMWNIRSFTSIMDSCNRWYHVLAFQLQLSLSLIPRPKPHPCREKGLVAFEYFLGCAQHTIMWLCHSSIDICNLIGLHKNKTTESVQPQKHSLVSPDPFPHERVGSGTRLA